MDANAIFATDTVSRTDQFTVFAREVKDHLTRTRLHRQVSDEATRKRDMVIDDEELITFLREREREINCELLLQYLISFCEHLPDPITEKWEGIDPYFQFRGLVGFEVDILAAEDVVDSVLEEYVKLGRFAADQLRALRVRIEQKHSDLIAWLIRTNGLGLRESLESQLRILQQLCLFWFQVKQENPHLYRKNDIFLFNLASRVLYRHFFKPMSAPMMRTR